jgi:hypothetical protein
MATQRDAWAGVPQPGDPEEYTLLKIWYQMQRLSQTGDDTAIASFTAATSSGTVAAGARQVTFVSDGTFAGTIGGATFPASQRLEMNAPLGGQLPAIAYTRSGGTLFISTVT